MRKFGIYTRLGEITLWDRRFIGEVARLSDISKSRGGEDATTLSGIEGFHSKKNHDRLQRLVRLGLIERLPASYKWHLTTDGRSVLQTDRETIIKIVRGSFDQKNRWQRRGAPLNFGCGTRESNPLFPAYETSVVIRSTRPQ